MKRLIIAALVVPFALEGQQRDSVITISANRATTIVPDRVATWVVVEGAGETPSDANNRLDAKLKSVTDAIRGLGPAAAAERPIPFGVALATTQGGYPAPPSPPTYISRAVIRLQILKLDQMASGIASVLAAGASSAGAPTFESSSIDATRRERMSEVIAIARADAEALATALGGKLGALVDVTSFGSSGPVNYGPGQIVFDSRYNSQQAQAPSITVTTNVTVRFRLIR